MPEQLLNREQAASRLSVSVRTLTRLVAAGELRRVRLRGCVRYDPDDLAALVRLHKEGPAVACDIAPRAITEGQLRAFHAKAADLDKQGRLARGSSKAQALVEASEKYGRLIDSAANLSSAEASWLLDHLERELVA